MSISGVAPWDRGQIPLCPVHAGPGATHGKGGQWDVGVKDTGRNDERIAAVAWSPNDTMLAVALLPGNP